MTAGARRGSSVTSVGARSAKAENVVDRPTHSGTTALARSAWARKHSASDAACSVTAAISLPRATSTLPLYSADSPMAAERADIDGTSTSTSFSESANGAAPAMSTVADRMMKDVGETATLAEAAWSSIPIFFCIRASASPTGS
eukprot:scaffold1583_cov105-Isochrysis_galbana.AAC.5